MRLSQLKETIHGLRSARLGIETNSCGSWPDFSVCPDSTSVCLPRPPVRIHDITSAVSYLRTLPTTCPFMFTILHKQCFYVTVDQNRPIIMKNNYKQLHRYTIRRLVIPLNTCFIPKLVIPLYALFIPRLVILLYALQCYSLHLPMEACKLIITCNYDRRA
jgi:hypothetical protein